MNIYHMFIMIDFFFFFTETGQQNHKSQGQEEVIKPRK